MIRRPPRSTLFPTRRSSDLASPDQRTLWQSVKEPPCFQNRLKHPTSPRKVPPDRKSTRLNSSHGYISYAVFCLKKKKVDKATPLLAPNTAARYEAAAHRALV